MTNALTFGGHDAQATSSTTPRHIWKSIVMLDAIHRGVSPEFLHAQNDRLNRFYSAGEPVWMSIDSMLKLWRGAELAVIADADGLAHIRAAARSAR